MNDNVTTSGVYCWVSSSSYPNTAWAQYTWSSAQTISSIVVHPDATTTRFLRRATIEYWTGSAWAADQTYLLSSYTTPYTINLTTQRTTTQLRLYSLETVGTQSSNPTIKEWQVYGPSGPTLTVAATAGSAQGTFANSTGTGSNGIQAGLFTITNNASGASTLNSITIVASGTGADNTAYTQVALYEDTNNSSAFEYANDTLYGTASTAFPADNGSIVFSQSQTFSVSQMRRYFVVVKLNGTPLPNSGLTFMYQVNDISVGTGNYKAGVPSTTMAGLTISPATLTFTDNTSATAVTAYPTTGGYLLQDFTVSYTAGPDTTLATVTLTAQGSGNDSTAYASIDLYFDTDSSGSYTGGDTQVATAASFSADNGTAALTLSGSNTFTAGGASRRYFVVVAFNATPTANQTFQTRITAVTGNYTSTTGNLPHPTAGFTAGATIGQLSFAFADASPASQTNAYLGGGDFVLQVFEVNYPVGPNNTIGTITLTAAGSGNDLSDYSSVRLYRESNANTSYDVGVDTLVDTVAAFGADNGTLNFTLAGAEAQFTAAQTKRYYVIAAFNMNGTNNTTFQSQVTAASNMGLGATASGTPAPASGPTAGLLLLANNLVVTFNGPGAATTVNNNEQGTGGIGVVLFDFSLQTIAAAWTVTDLTFTAQGTANHQTAYNFLALYFDGNSSGGYDGGDTLAVATAGVAFNGANQYTATLVNSSFPATTTRRYFLVAKLAGTATTGQTLNAQLTGSTTTPPSGGTVTTIPTATSTALIIDSPVLSAFNGGAAPAGTMLEGGAAQTHTAAQFAFTASNNPSVLNGITLTTSGTGTWNVDVPSVEIYQDDGNGVYDVADTLIFTGAGATPTIACTFTSAVNIANGATVSIWVRLGFSATAGASVPETFAVSIANAADISVTGATALLGTPAPTSNTTSVVMFFVTTFVPAFDMQTGGAAITITGSGFLSPVTLTIGGAVCPGTAVIGAGGTQITGLTVPPGTGANKVIVLSNGALGAKTLTQTFDYAGGSIIGTGGGGGGGGGSGCEANDAGAAWLAALALLAVAASLSLRRRIAR